jgi:hypothetical protein
VSALLNPVTAATGISETTISKLVDNSAVSYRDLIGLAACIKIHLSETGAGRDVILAAGNIGQASSSPISRSGIGVCKSE